MYQKKIPPIFIMFKKFGKIALENLLYFCSRNHKKHKTS